MIVSIYACMAIAQWCSTHNLTFMIERPSPMACHMAQAHIAQWAGMHPKWQVVRWECKSAGIAELVKAR